MASKPSPIISNIAKQFNTLQIMDIVAIKGTLGYPKLELNVATNAEGVEAKTTDAKGVETRWLRHWDNTKRVAVSIAENLFTEIKANPVAITNLSLQTEILTGAQGEYTAHRIIRYTPAQFEL